MTATTIQPWEVKRQQVREFSDWCAITGRDPLEEAVREHIETLEAITCSPECDALHWTGRYNGRCPHLPTCPALPAGVRGITEAEYALFSHCSRWGAEGYPILEVKGGYTWGAEGVAGPPVVFKTKAEAVASFEAWEGVILDALAGRLDGSSPLPESAEPPTSPRAFLESFWPGQEITADAILAHRHSPDHEYGYLESIRGRMLAESAMDDSDAEIERTLSPCVAGELLVNVAKFLRNEGVSLLPPPTPSILYNLNFAYEASSDAEALEVMREGTYQEAGCVLRVAGDGRCVGGIDPDSVGPFPAEPAFNSPEAVETASETIRAMHTPGPWECIPYGDAPISVAAHTDSPVAVVYGSTRDHREADAALIAAAPELADELEKLLQAVEQLIPESRRGPKYHSVLAPVRLSASAALAKAGRS